MLAVIYLCPGFVDHIHKAIPLSHKAIKFICSLGITSFQSSPFSLHPMFSSWQGPERQLAGCGASCVSGQPNIQRRSCSWLSVVPWWHLWFSRWISESFCGLEKASFWCKSRVKVLASSSHSFNWYLKNIYTAIPWIYHCHSIDIPWLASLICLQLPFGDIFASLCIPLRGSWRIELNGLIRVPKIWFILPWPWTSCAPAQEPSDHLGVPESLAFDVFWPLKVSEGQGAKIAEFSFCCGPLNFKSST